MFMSCKQNDPDAPIPVTVQVVLSGNRDGSSVFSRARQARANADEIRFTLFNWWWSLIVEENRPPINANMKTWHWPLGLRVVLFAL